MLLAQANFFNPGGQNGSSIFGQGQQSNNNQTQAVSGGAPFMSLSSSMNSNQGMNNQPGGAIFAIPPESVREFRVGTCAWSTASRTREASSSMNL